MRRKLNDLQQTFFMEEECLEKLNTMQDTLFKLKDFIPWENFRPQLVSVRKDNSVKGGRPPYDEVMMFKCLVLAALYDLSDERLEFLIIDRRSFMAFLGLCSYKDAPDHNTIWRFRELLNKHQLLRPLFDTFDSYLQQQGLIICKGLVTDATFADAPQQHNTREENKQIKEGKTPESFEKKSVQEMAHKDMDARWAKKNGEVHYGYKNHITADTTHKLIRKWRVTPANVHDSSVFLSILPERSYSGQFVYADSAYNSSEIIAELEYRGFHPKICEKGYCNHPLTEEQKLNNSKKSKIRCRVEHIFGDMTNRMKTKTVRTIGLARAEVKIGLMNLAYNMRRYLTITKKKASIALF